MGTRKSLSKLLTTLITFLKKVRRIHSFAFIDSRSALDKQAHKKIDSDEDNVDLCYDYDEPEKLLIECCKDMGATWLKNVIDCLGFNLVREVEIDNFNDNINDIITE